jgi:hypothetical protein
MTSQGSVKRQLQTSKQLSNTQQAIVNSCNPRAPTNICIAHLKSFNSKGSGMEHFSTQTNTDWILSAENQRTNSYISISLAMLEALAQHQTYH